MIRPGERVADDIVLRSPNLNFERWHVQDNVAVSHAITNHVISWYRDEGDTTEHVVADGVKGKQNRGSEFIQRLQVGDRIGLVPRAMASEVQHNLRFYS